MSSPNVHVRDRMRGRVGSFMAVFLHHTMFTRCHWSGLKLLWSQCQFGLSGRPGLGVVAVVAYNKTQQI